jgi:hypothetical protein
VGGVYVLLRLCFVVLLRLCFVVLFIRFLLYVSAYFSQFGTIKRLRIARNKKVSLFLVLCMCYVD